MALTREEETIEISRKYKKQKDGFRFVAIVRGRSLIYWKGVYLWETRSKDRDYCSKCACIEMNNNRHCPVFLLLRQTCPTMKMGAYFKAIGNSFTGV